MATITGNETCIYCDAGTCEYETCYVCGRCDCERCWHCHDRKCRGVGCQPAESDMEWYDPADVTA